MGIDSKKRNSNLKGNAATLFELRNTQSFVGV